ncbi:MAG: hypothetical protein D8B54_08020 [Catonella sp.]|nr:MAG: hypothetical protein D8B54_08020 [Catonella sp.]
MEGMLRIDGREIRLKATAATPIRYRSEFGVDFFKDVYRFGVSGNTIAKSDSGKAVTDEELNAIELDCVYRLLWAFAKEADKDILPFMEWLESFDVLPFTDCAKAISPLINKLMQSKKQKTPTQISRGKGKKKKR